MDLIVAIDLIDGELVRLSKGAYETKRVYAKDPVEVAKAVEGVGLKRLHLVDLDGAKAGKPINLPVLERMHEKRPRCRCREGSEMMRLLLWSSMQASQRRTWLSAVHTPTRVHG